MVDRETTESVAISAFILSIFTICCNFVTATVFMRYTKQYVTIRFRFPRVYLGWCIFSSIYILSRLVYGLEYLTHSDWPEWVDTVDDIARVLGINGAIFLLFVRVWLYSFTYKYDHIVLQLDSQHKEKDDDTNTNSKNNGNNCVCCQRINEGIASIVMSHKNTFGNEKWLLKYAMIVVILLSIIVSITRAVDAWKINYFSQIYYGFNFLVAVIVCGSVITNKHDLLGLFEESIYYFLLHIVCIGFILTMEFFIETDNNEDFKRVSMWLGGTGLFFCTNAICSYVVFVRFKLFKETVLPTLRCESRKKNESSMESLTQAMDDDKGKINRNHLELVYVLAQERNIRVFRRFLADIYCIENLDFFVTVQHYRAMCESELEEIVAAIHEKQGKSSENETNDNNEKEDAIVGNVTKLDPLVSEDENEDYDGNHDVDTPDTPDLKRATTFEALTTNMNRIESDYEGNETENDRKQNEKHIEKHEKSVGSTLSKLRLLVRGDSKSKAGLPRQRSIQSKNVTDLADAAKPYIKIDTTTNQESLEITKIAVHQPNIEKMLKGRLSWKDRAKWIFNAYIPANSQNCLNLSSKMRKQYVKQFNDLGLYQPKSSRVSIFNVAAATSNLNDLSRNLAGKYQNMELEDLEKARDELEKGKGYFDTAQAEVWKLMAQDSMTHFRNSDHYEKVFRFVDNNDNV